MFHRNPDGHDYPAQQNGRVLLPVQPAHHLRHIAVVGVSEFYDRNPAGDPSDGCCNSESEWKDGNQPLVAINLDGQLRPSKLSCYLLSKHAPDGQIGTGSVPAPG